MKQKHKTDQNDPHGAQNLQASCLWEYKIFDSFK